MSLLILAVANHNSWLCSKRWRSERKCPWPCVLKLRNYIPSRPHITDVLLLKLHDFVTKHVNSLLQDILAVNFTADIWSSSVSPMSLIGLTAQWIDEDFIAQRVIPHAQQFWSLHTSKAIEWYASDMGHPNSSVHTALQDNAGDQTVWSKP